MAVADQLSVSNTEALKLPLPLWAISGLGTCAFCRARETLFTQAAPHDLVWRSRHKTAYPLFGCYWVKRTYCGHSELFRF